MKFAFSIEIFYYKYSGKRTDNEKATQLSDDNCVAKNRLLQKNPHQVLADKS